MRQSLRIGIEFGDEHECALVAESLPEARDSKGSVSLDVDGRRLTMVIHADEPSSLRATANSYLRYVRVADDAIAVSRKL